MKVKIEGLKELEKALGRYVKSLGDAFAKGSEDAAETFLNNNDMYVKYETGALRESGVWFQENGGFQTQTIIGYGAQIDSVYIRDGRTQPQEPEEYALYQHDEQPSALFPGTHFMWMDRGVDMFQPIMVSIIVQEMRRV